MSEDQTNPQEEKAEVEDRQLSMYDVMFGSEESTNPEPASVETEEEDTDVEELSAEEESDEVSEEEVEEEEVPEGTTTVLTGLRKCFSIPEHGVTEIQHCRLERVERI